MAGITGWTGGAVAEAVAAADDLELRSGVSRSAAGGEAHGAPVHASVEEALEGVDVLIDYTSHDSVKASALTAIERGVAVVIGTSGLTADEFAEIDEAARARGVGVISSGNFSVHRSDGAGRGAARREAHPLLGGDRLRERRQGRRAERHRSRAGREAR